MIVLNPDPVKDRRSSAKAAPSHHAQQVKNDDQKSKTRA
jgi:hypothetical protein